MIKLLALVDEVRVPVLEINLEFMAVLLAELL